jgi:hypothetical protein
MEKMTNPHIKLLVKFLRKEYRAEYQELIGICSGNYQILNEVYDLIDKVEDDVTWFESRYEVHPQLSKLRRLVSRLIQIRVDLEQNESGSEQKRIRVPS